jgi:ribose 5-phosphate isomerase A
VEQFMSQDALKQAAAKAAAALVPEGAIVGVGTGSTVNFFIDELARMKGGIEGAACASCRYTWTAPTK